jgi:hypothetical protein
MFMKNLTEMKNRYEDKGFSGLEYSDMDVLFSLENRLIDAESKLRIYEESFKKIIESETLSVAQRVARITLG